MGLRYIADIDDAFDDYAACLPVLLEWARARYPKATGDSDFVYQQSLKAMPCDAARGILPAATLSNVGIYGTGQAFEALLRRMRAHPLPEAQQYAAMMLTELRKVIPWFLTRVDRPERGGAWTEYLRETRQATAELVGRVLGGETPEPRPAAVLTPFAPPAEEKLPPPASTPHPHLPHDQTP